MGIVSETDAGKIGWARVRAAGLSVRNAAQITVMKAFMSNAGYIGSLGYDQLSEIIVNQLLYDGWTLTPPQGDPDECTDPERDRGKDGSSASG